MRRLLLVALLLVGCGGFDRVTVEDLEPDFEQRACMRACMDPCMRWCKDSWSITEPDCTSWGCGEKEIVCEQRPLVCGADCQNECVPSCSAECPSSAD